MVKKILFILLGLALLFGGVWFFKGCGSSRSYTNYPPTAKGRWVAFGDSLTAGTGANEGSDYPTLLSAKLGIEIVNKGTPGDTTTDALGKVDGVAGLEPAVVLLCLGGNDGLRGRSAEGMIQTCGKL